jgi:hypothetical protein
MSDADAALLRVKAYVAGMRKIAEATMLPDVRELLEATVDGLESAIRGDS